MKKWTVTADGFGYFYCERGNEFHEIKAHCLACAKAEIVTKYGGTVDARGWHKQGVCGSYMRVVARELDETH